MFDRWSLPKRFASVSLALVLAFALSLPVRADVIVGGGPVTVIVDTDLPFVSNNIDVLGTLPIVGAIGANFHPLHNRFMYVTGVEGLTTLDIGDPARPRVTDFDPLPHFENEDVSVGGNLLLIANDSAEGIGLLYVFDISTPAAPVLRGQPIVLDTIASDVTSASTVPSHTVTCIKGCQFAYLAGNSSGITIVDLRNLDAPKIAGTFKPAITGFATHDITLDAYGLAWIAGGDGTAAYDIQNPLRPRLRAITDFSGTAGLNDFIHHNSLRPSLVGGRKSTSIVYITEEDYARPTCQDAGSFQTWKMNNSFSPSKLTNLDSWVTELDELTRTAGHSPATILCSAHWFDARNGIVAQGWYEQGTRILDVRNPYDIKQIGYFVMPTTETWDAKWAPTDPNGQVLYTIDFARGIDILRFNNTNPNPAPIKAPVRQSWIAADGATSVPSSAFTTAHPTFRWACRVPQLTQ